MTDMLDLESRLRSLGGDLALDESDALVVAVLDRLEEHRDSTPPARSRPAAPWLRAAAVVVIAGAAVALALPSSRQAIADWFGLDGVDIEQQPDLSVPDEPPAVDDVTPVGSGTVVEVDGADILVGEIEVGAVEVGELDGVLDEALITKTLAAGTGIERVEVAGNLGLWIAGEPHVVTYVDRDGQQVTERFAGNTLLWQDGEMIHRLEGFETLEDAVAFAESPD